MRDVVAACRQVYALRLPGLSSRPRVLASPAKAPGSELRTGAAETRPYKSGVSPGPRPLRTDPAENSAGAGSGTLPCFTVIEGERIPEAGEGRSIPGAPGRKKPGPVARCSLTPPRRNEPFVCEINPGTCGLRVGGVWVACGARAHAQQSRANRHL